MELDLRMYHGLLEKQAKREKSMHSFHAARVKLCRPSCSPTITGMEPAQKWSKPLVARRSVKESWIITKDIKNFKNKALNISGTASRTMHSERAPPANKKSRKKWTSCQPWQNGNPTHISHTVRSDNDRCSKTRDVSHRNSCKWRSPLFHYDTGTCSHIEWKSIAFW